MDANSSNADNYDIIIIGAGSVVTDNVPDFALMLGNPARQAGWMSRYGERMDFPVEGDGSYKCPHTGESYTLINNIVSLESN